MTDYDWFIDSMTFIYDIMIIHLFIYLLTMIRWLMTMTLCDDDKITDDDLWRFGTFIYDMTFWLIMTFIYLWQIMTLWLLRLTMTLDDDDYWWWLLQMTHDSYRCRLQTHRLTLLRWRLLMTMTIRMMTVDDWLIVGLMMMIIYDDDWWRFICLFCWWLDLLWR